jgi:hypothetical protein
MDLQQCERGQRDVDNEAVDRNMRIIGTRPYRRGATPINMHRNNRMVLLIGTPFLFVERRP